MRSRSVVLLGRDDERDDERARRVTENRFGRTKRSSHLGCREIRSLLGKETAWMSKPGRPVGLMTLDPFKLQANVCRVEVGTGGTRRSPRLLVLVGG
jgi:hypothetical protein